ncbi:MAG TPA: phage major capsid protein [Thermoleophilaceae bacterium]|nr:phage major capsid protein [Thermoleophilaceae bacterium]
MTTTTITDPAELRREREAARQDAQRYWAEYDKARTDLIGRGVPSTDTAAWAAAERLYTQHLEAAHKFSQLSDSEETLSPTPSALPATSSGHGVAEMLTGTPGALLSAILHRRRDQVAQFLPSDLSAQVPALDGVPLDTSHISTEVESQAVIDLLTPLSVAAASGIQIHRIETTKARIPRFTAPPEAAWVPELQPFPKTGPGIERVEVEPPKVGLVMGLSVEVFEDLSPLMLSMIQTSLMRAVALEFDKGILFGSGLGGEPLGVANTPGIAVEEAPLYDLSAFTGAISTLFATNARPAALVMNPTDVGTLLALVEWNGGAGIGTGSNVPLWKTNVTGGPTGLKLPFFEIPVWPTPACPEGTALMYDPTVILTILRRGAELAIDPHYGFDEGEVGLRVYLRGEGVVGQPGGVVALDLAIPQS